MSVYIDSMFFRNYHIIPSLIRVFESYFLSLDGSIDDQSVSRLWENFVEKLEPYQVKLDVIRWRARHAELYIRTDSEQRWQATYPKISNNIIRRKTETASLPNLAWPRCFVELGEFSKVGG